MKQTIPLSMMSQGETATIVSLEGGRNFKKRLDDLGLYVGAKIEMLKNDFRGPIIVKVLDSKMVLGGGQSQKIFINLLQS